MFLQMSESLFAQQKEIQKHTISGCLKLDTIWEPTVYLSFISSFNDLYRMSGDMILETAKVDSVTGCFEFKADYLPQEDILYRIHVSKKGDPPISLIIGGDKENHVFFIANKHSHIYIENHKPESIFKGVHIKGYAPNDILKKIDEISSYKDSTDLNQSVIKRELITNAVFENLRYIADTCNHPLVSLYALYESKFESNFPINQEFYRNYLKKWEKEQSSYFKAFRMHIPDQNGNGILLNIIIGIIALILGMLLNFYYKQLVHKRKDVLNSLSVQERKIFVLIQNGKSNKEISEEFNIGISTVKTHVSNIYSKLKINSRKEALDIKH